MHLTVLGCSGSVVGLNSPASGYLLQAPETPPIVLDFGGGVLGALQRYLDPGVVHILLSHLHADHCLDLPGLAVWRRYNPNRPTGKALLYGPTDTWLRISRASSPHGEALDDISDVFEVHTWCDNEPIQLGSLIITPRHLAHPTESFGLRITDRQGITLVYSGDTGYCDNLISLAQGAHVLLCEASWTDHPLRPRNLHLSGREAGQIAHRAGVRHLLLTHIPPWENSLEILAEAQQHFDGPISVVHAGQLLDLSAMIYGALAKD